MMRPLAYYNEIDGYCCDWLSNLMDAGLITPGTIDDRSIADVQPDDVRGYKRVHWFAGIAGWDIALRLAGWPDDRPVWTGSCPCQKFSSAARGRNTAEDLWPFWLPLITADRPREIFGEQVANRGWIDRLCDDLEPLGYEVGAAVLPACSVGKDHARPRLYFACHADRNSEPRLPVDGKVDRMSRRGSDAGSMGTSNGIRHRASQLRAYGNAIVPHVAAEFIGAFMSASQRNYV